jgi:MFS family permease
MGPDDKKAVGAPLPASVPYKVFLIFFAMFQITLGAGIIVGWASIAGSMLVETTEKGGAGLTLDQTTKLFGLAASVNYISPFFLGLILDNGGPRACSMTSNAVVAVGCIVFSLANEFSTFLVGLSLIAFGGPGVQTSLMHVGNLFPERRFFVMGVVAESITLSFAVLPVLDVIWDSWDCGFRKLFAGLGCLLFLSSLSSFFLWPDSPYETPKEEEENDTATHVLLPHESDITTSSVKLQDRSFKEQLTSGVFTRLWIFFLVTSWWANFYIAVVTTEVRRQKTMEGQDLLGCHPLNF